MADPIAQLRRMDEKGSNDSDEKLSVDSNGKIVDDAVLVKVHYCSLVDQTKPVKERPTGWLTKKILRHQ